MIEDREGTDTTPLQACRIQSDCLLLRSLIRLTNKKKGVVELFIGQLQRPMEATAVFLQRRPTERSSCFSATAVSFVLSSVLYES
jgi:hypothetical protein